MEKLEESKDATGNRGNENSLSENKVGENVDEDMDMYEKESEKWYSIAILVLAVVGLAINITAVIIMRRKKGIFHTMLKVYIFSKNEIDLLLFPYKNTYQLNFF